MNSSSSAPAGRDLRARHGSRVRLARIARGLSQQALAASAGITRQALAGVEAGRWDPSLRVALALSEALGVAVEELFGPEPAPPAVQATPLAPVRARTRVLLGRVGGRQVALPLQADVALRPGVASAGGVVARLDPEAPLASDDAEGPSVTVAPLGAAPPTLVVAGCDPALPLLAEPLSVLSPPVALAWWPCGTARALELAAAGLVHVAGVHLADGGGGPAALVERGLRGAGAEVIGFSAWQEGLVVSAPAGRLRGLADLAERKLRLVNREAGSEARALLDAEMAAAGVSPALVAGYRSEVRAQMLVASGVAAGLGDAGPSIEPAAIAYGLSFLALAAEHFHLVVPSRLLGSAEVQALLRVLASRQLHRQIGQIPGYSAAPCGEPVCSVPARPGTA